MLSRALQLDPDEPNIFNTLAMIHLANHQYDSAGRMIDKALAIRPNDAYFVNNRGYLALLTNRLDDGRVDIDQSIITDPDNGWAYRNKGLYFLLKGNISEAVRLLEKAHSMDPFIERIDLYLGDAYVAAGQREKGCMHFGEAVKRGDMTTKEKSEKCK